VEIDPIHPRWKEKVEGTIPLTRAIWRKVHNFIEGYPEQGVFTRHQDVGYLLAYAATNAPMAVVSEVPHIPFPAMGPEVTNVTHCCLCAGNRGLQEIPR